MYVFDNDEYDNNSLKNNNFSPTDEELNIFSDKVEKICEGKENVGLYNYCEFLNNQNNENKSTDIATNGLTTENENPFTNDTSAVIFKKSNEDEETNLTPQCEENLESTNSINDITTITSFKYINKQRKYERDGFIKKNKTYFGKFITKTFNKLIRAYDRVYTKKNKIKKLSNQNFTHNPNINFNKFALQQTIEKIYTTNYDSPKQNNNFLNNEKIVKFLKEKLHYENKSKDAEILDKFLFKTTLREVMENYFNSKQFELDKEDVREKECNSSCGDECGGLCLPYA
jgi:hypothetical protein